MSMAFRTRSHAPNPEAKTSKAITRVSMIEHLFGVGGATRTLTPHAYSEPIPLDAAA